MCHSNTECGVIGKKWNKPVWRELGPQSSRSHSWRHAGGWKGRGTISWPFPSSYSLIPCQCLPCLNRARNQLTWERRDCSQQVDTQQSKENDLWANRPRTKECLQLTQMFKTQIFIPRTSSFCLFSCLRGCQQLPRLTTWISHLTAFLSSFWQSIAKSFDLCSLYLSKELFFSIPTIHRSFRSPPFDINDHTSLLTDLLLLDLPLAFIPIHFTHTLNYSINLTMSTSCLKPFFCGAPVGCPQNEIQSPFLRRSFKSGPFCFQPRVFICSLIHANKCALSAYSVRHWAKHWRHSLPWMIQAVTNQHPENHIPHLLPLLQPLPPSLIPFPSFLFFLLILDESFSKQPPFMLQVQTCILSKNPQCLVHTSFH